MSFDSAIPVILAHEGSEFTDYPEDYGGATKWGITLRTFQRVRPGATRQELRELDEMEARWIYRRLYWDEYRIEEIVDETVQTKVFDLFVNLSPHSAAGVIQKALRRLSIAIPVDGIIGPRTIAAINAADPESLIFAIISEQRRFYQGRADADPSQRKFLRGWLARAEWPLNGSDSRFT